MYKNKEELSIFTSSYCPRRVGRNVAAGMTGGLAYILDEDDTLIPKVRVGSMAVSCFLVRNSYIRLLIRRAYVNR